MNRREQVLVGVGAVVVAGSLWYALTPSGAPGANANLLPLKQAVAKTAASKVNVRKLREEQSAVEPSVKVRAYNTPPEQLVPVVVGNLQAAADRAGIHLREVRPLRPKLVTDESDPKAVAQTTTGRSRTGNAAHEVLGSRVPVEVRFRAQFQPNVVKFLYDLENPNSRMVIDKISITSADARFQTVEVSAQVTVFTRSAIGAAGGDTGEIANDTATKS